MHHFSAAVKTEYFWIVSALSLSQAFFVAIVRDQECMSVRQLRWKSTYINRLTRAWDEPEIQLSMDFFTSYDKIEWRWNGGTIIGFAPRSALSLVHLALVQMRDYVISSSLCTVVYGDFMRNQTYITLQHSKRPRCRTWSSIITPVRKDRRCALLAYHTVNCQSEQHHQKIGIRIA